MDVNCYTNTFYVSYQMNDVYIRNVSMLINSFFKFLACITHLNKNLYCEFQTLIHGLTLQIQITAASLLKV